MKLCAFLPRAYVQKPEICPRLCEFLRNMYKYATNDEIGAMYALSTCFPQMNELRTSNKYGCVCAHDIHSHVASLHHSSICTFVLLTRL